jgi:hypothetical protein
VSGTGTSFKYKTLVNIQVSGTSNWYLYLVQVPGICTQVPDTCTRYLVPVPGTGTWYKYLVQVPGTGTWYRYLVQKPGTCTWYRGYTLVDRSILGTCTSYLVQAVGLIN